MSKDSKQVVSVVIALLIAISVIVGLSLVDHKRHGAPAHNVAPPCCKVVDVHGEWLRRSIVWTELLQMEATDAKNAAARTSDPVKRTVLLSYATELQKHADKAYAEDRKIADETMQLQAMFQDIPVHKHHWYDSFLPF